MPIRVRGKKPRQRHFLRQWREKRGLTQAQLAERLETTEATISRVENGKQPYTQDLLEAWADAVLTDYVSLLIRDPSDPEAIWSLWDRAKPAQKKKIVRAAQAALKTG